MMFALVVSLMVGLSPAGAADSQPPVILTPTVSGTVAGWLVDFADERNYMLNTYLRHLDYLAQDPAYTLAVTDVPVMIALLELAPERAADVRRFHAEGRLEFANAFLLSGALGLTGGEALMRLGIEGVYWQERVFDARPRTLWLVDSTGIPDQMPQIAAQLGVRGVVFTRNNPMPTATFRWLAPDGSAVLATASGTYAHLPELFLVDRPLRGRDFRSIESAILTFRGFETPGAPTLLPVAAGDYSPPPRTSQQASHFLREWRETRPNEPLRFGTPSGYFEALAAADTTLPEFAGEIPYGFGAFWVNVPRARQGFRQAEHQLQAADALASVASLTGETVYPSEELTHGWLNLLMNMDRSALWGVGAGSVFESPTVWDVRDRFAATAAATDRVIDAAFRSLLDPGGRGDTATVTLFNPLNWERADPVIIRTPGGRGLDGVPCQAQADPDQVLCTPQLPPFGAVTFGLGERPALPVVTEPKDAFETAHYAVQFDAQTGDISGLRLKANGRELLAGPGNAIVAESQTEPAVDVLLPRARRQMEARSSDTPPTWSITEGPVSTTIVTTQPLIGSGSLRREVRLHRDHPRIDFETTLSDVPDGTLVLADFPLAEPAFSTARGIPYGYTERNPADTITPAVRWSSYALVGGSTVSLLDVGTPAREMTGATASIPLLNAHDRYRGLPNAWLSGSGQHTFRYALVGAPGDWRSAGVPRLSWELNAAPVVHAGALLGCGQQSWLSTSDNLIVESVRRVDRELEIRLVDWIGLGGPSRVEVSLPHSAAFKSDPLGESRERLAGGPAYALDLAPQQIVTLRLAVDATPAPSVPPLTSFRPLAPPEKQASLEIRHQKDGHPPEGDTDAP